MGGDTPPDQNQAAVAGIKQQIANYPYSYLVNALSQMGGKKEVIAPDGTKQVLDFTGLGTADVQNQFQNQMAQTMLDIQNGLGSQFVAQRLANLKQSDPTGYAAYQQEFDKIMADAQAQPPNMPLSQATQDSVNRILQQSQSLTSKESQQVGQGVRGNQVASGIYLGNAPAQAEAIAQVGALDQKQNAAQQEASAFLKAGISPSDIQYRKTQQDMANLGAFINGQDPMAQFSSLTGAQSGAAPYPNSGYSTPMLNEGQAAQQGINQANSLYSINQQQANPYMAGLSMAATGVKGIAQAFKNPYTTQIPYSVGEGWGTGASAGGSYVPFTSGNAGVDFSAPMGGAADFGNMAITPM